MNLGYPNDQPETKRCNQKNDPKVGEKSASGYFFHPDFSVPGHMNLLETDIKC